MVFPSLSRFLPVGLLLFRLILRQRLERSAQPAGTRSEHRQEQKFHNFLGSAKVLSDDLLALPDNYEVLLQDLKSRIQQAQVKAFTSVNTASFAQWQIGSDILARQARQGWRAEIIDWLSVDLHGTFPETKGLSARSLKYTRAFATAWPDIAIVQAPLAQLTRVLQSRADRKN
jgi:hypothetical protein